MHGFPAAGTRDFVSTAYLIDPVDVSRFSPESADNPSGGLDWVVGVGAGMGVGVGVGWRGGTAPMLQQPWKDAAMLRYGCYSMLLRATFSSARRL